MILEWITDIQSPSSKELQVREQWVGGSGRKVLYDLVCVFVNGDGKYIQSLSQLVLSRVWHICKHDRGVGPCAIFMHCSSYFSP